MTAHAHCSGSRQRALHILRSLTALFLVPTMHIFMSTCATRSNFYISAMQCCWSVTGPLREPCQRAEHRAWMLNCNQLPHVRLDHHHPSALSSRHAHACLHASMQCQRLWSKRRRCDRRHQGHPISHQRQPWNYAAEAASHRLLSSRVLRGQRHYCNLLSHVSVRPHRQSNHEDTLIVLVGL